MKIGDIYMNSSGDGTVAQKTNQTECGSDKLDQIGLAKSIQVKARIRLEKCIIMDRMNDEISPNDGKFGSNRSNLYGMILIS